MRGYVVVEFSLHAVGLGVFLGFFVALGLLVAGTVATILWKNASKGGDISLIVIYGLTALLGFVNLGTFSDLAIWSSWALFCAIMAGVALYLHSQ